MEGTHHSQKQGLLQESEECTDQGLQACEAAKLRGGVPAGAVENLSPQGAMLRLPTCSFAAWPQVPVPPGCTSGGREEVGMGCASLDRFLLSSSAKRICLLDQREAPGPRGVWPSQVGGAVPAGVCSL